MPAGWYIFIITHCHLSLPHTDLSLSLGKPSTQLLQSVIWLPVGRYVHIISHCHLSVLVTSLFHDKLPAKTIAEITPDNAFTYILQSTM